MYQTADNLCMDLISKVQMTEPKYDRKIIYLFTVISRGFAGDLLPFYGPIKYPGESSQIIYHILKRFSFSPFPN